MKFIHALGNIEPTLVLTIDEEFTSGNQVHQIIGRAEPDITVQTTQLSRGTYELFFQFETDAIAAMALLRQPGIWSVEDPDLQSMDFKFVTLGQVVKEQTATKQFWVIRIGFQVVS